MINPVARDHNPALTEAIVSASGRNQASQSQSFAAELSDKLSSTLKSGSKAAELPASLPASQQIVTWRDPGPISPPTTPTQPSGLNGLVITYPSGTSGTTSTAAVGSQDSPTSFDQAYWAQQPAAVQQLQTIQSPAERAEVATQLAQEGYTIDVPIMVWGWDPATTTAARESMGYTWVPSADQQPVEVAPGLTYAGTSYNPAQPPSGSIMV
jgi:hypothetical protein